MHEDATHATRRMKMNYQLESRRRSLPFLHPVHTAHGPWKCRETLQLKVTSASGVVAYAEATPLPWGRESIDEDESVLRQLCGMREDPAPWLGLPAHAGSARGALRSALMEACGQERALVHEHLSVAALLPSGVGSLERLRSRIEQGYRCFKWKVGVLDLADELSILDDLCALLPTGARLRLDANGAWDRRRSERWLERCAERPVEFVEQPIAPGFRGAEDLLRGLAEDYPVPIALDESVIGDAELLRWHAEGWPGLLVVKPNLLEDCEGTLEVLAKGTAKLVFSSALETRIGAGRALRAAFCWTGETRALGFGVWPLFAEPLHDALVSAPFIRRQDLGGLNPELSWTAKD